MPIVWATGQQGALGHLVERDAEQLGDPLLAVADEVDRRPRRAEATLPEGEHQAPHGREQRSPRACAHRRRGVLQTAPHARDDEQRGAVHVVGEVLRRVGDLVEALRRACRCRRSRVVAASGRSRSWPGRSRRSPVAWPRPSTTTQCQPCRLPPVGACKAISRHSSTSDHSTGRSKSSRLRTERVVVSSSSAVRLRCIRLSVAPRPRTAHYRRGGVLFPNRMHDGLRDGSITVTFRHWKRPQAKVGGRYRTGGGDLVVESIEPVRSGAITDDDARRRRGSPTPPRCVERCAGATTSPCCASPSTARNRPCPPAPSLDDDEIDRRLDRLDAASPTGPWTRATLDLIARRPAVRAGDLAARARPRAAAVQGRRAQAQTARPHREPRRRLPPLAAGSRLPRSSLSERDQRQWPHE